MVPFLVNGNLMLPTVADVGWLLNARVNVTATVAASLSFQSWQSYGYIDTLPGNDYSHFFQPGRPLELGQHSVNHGRV